ncbi:MAG: UvrD-helicase domain-containing protein [Desulfobaccales bacterium]
MGAPKDQDVRVRALDPRESFHLEAPAGSGKTAVLLARFLTLLAEVEESPREILALTFTRKAAGEFRERVRRYFWSQEDFGPDPPPHERLLLDLAGRAFQHLERKNLAHQYLTVPERLPITTFHGFCAQLLKAAPHEAGVPLDFTILESDQEAAWQKQEVLEELRRQLSSRPATDPVRQAFINRLVRLNNNWPRLARELRDLLARRDTLKDFLALAHKSLKEAEYVDLMERRLSETAAEVLAPLAESFAATELFRRWPGFAAAVASGGAWPGDVPVPQDPPAASSAHLSAWQNLAEVLLTKNGDLRKRWPKTLANGEWPEIFHYLPENFLVHLNNCRKLPQQLFDPGELGALHDLILLLNAAWQVHEDLCRQRRALDFIALEEAALRLLNLESPGELLLRLDWRLRHLLVDEFQDTSDNQTELLCRLLAGWTAGDGRTLTVVGDPKQSIYGWRQARLRLFLDARHGLPCGGRQAVPLTPLSLTTNFRSTPTLITWVNQVFGKTVMANVRDCGGLTFQPAEAAPNRLDADPPALALFADEDSDEARRQEACWLADRITLARKGLPPGERLALLLFARNHLTTYLAALQAAGLVPKVREGLKLTESTVVQHLHNLARALVRPQDEVAWAALLRAPWSESDLAALAAAAQTPGVVWPEKLAAVGSSHDCPSELAQHIQVLLKAREQVGREPLAATVESFLTDLQAWDRLAAWEGALGVACARTYLRLLTDAEAGLPEATFVKADFALQDAYQPPDPRAEDSPVEVLTVHGAKGLEFHTVFVPYLDWCPLGRGGDSPPFLLEEIPGVRGHVLALAPPAWESGQDSSYRLVKALRDARLLAEARRVFYVAVTRARQRLFLSGVLSRRQGSFTPPANSPLAWLWEHYRLGEVPGGGSHRWPDPPLLVEICPERKSLPPFSSPLQVLPGPLKLVPEPPPYRLVYPSQTAADAASLKAPAAEGHGDDGDPVAARARGEIIHRLFAAVAQGKGLPPEKSVAAALIGLGLPPEPAWTLAPDILAEVAACLQDPFLQPLLAPEAARSEWLLEDQPAPGVIRRGRLDLLAFDGQDWWLVDFKTSRPPTGVPWDDFLRSEMEKYRPQLAAYREMIANLRGLSPQAIRPALYFTACRQAVEF